MAGSLRDQLVKAGLATTGQAKKAERETRAEKNAQLHGKPGKAQQGKKHQKARSDPSSPENVRERARQLKAEKVERDRAIARVGNEKTAAKALRAEIKQIILQNNQRASAVKENDVAYNFVHGKKIKKIFVPRAQQQQLSSGQLVIVNNDGLYYLVSSKVAEQISARDSKRIIASHQSEPATPTADDDYYAKFEVPDDLDW